MDFITIFLSIVLAVLGLYIHHIRTNPRFEEHGIPYVSPIPILGNMAPVFLRMMSFADMLERLYKTFPDAKYIGFYYFMTPVIIIREPQLFSEIAVKNFDSFVDHHDFVDKKLDPLFGKNLFSLRGDTWREMRKVLTPAFTSSKMKMMFRLVSETANNFTNFLATDVSNRGKVIEAKDLLRKYMNDVVASCAFGINVDSMREPDNEFFVLSNEAMNFDGWLSTKLFITQNFRLISRVLQLHVFSDRVNKFFRRIVGEQVKMREEQKIIRPDMIHLMMESRGKTNVAQLNIDDMTAQAFVFFLGGFDTTSTYMSFLLHDLAVNPDVKTKLVAEIKSVLEERKGKPVYDSIIYMKYLDAVANESLRLRTLAIFLQRECNKTYELPPATKNSQAFTVKPKMPVWFSNYGVHRDSRFFRDPYTYDPSRFLEKEVDQTVFTPFGLGPRSCIGNRFALMTTKVLIFYLLARCDIEICEKTDEKMEISPRSMIVMAKNGCWLRIREKVGADRLKIEPLSESETLVADE